DTSQTRLLIAERRLRRIQPHAWIDLGILVKRDQIGVRVARKSVRKKCVHAVGDGRNRSLALSRSLVRRAFLTAAGLWSTNRTHVYSSLFGLFRLGGRRPVCHPCLRVSVALTPDQRVSIRTLAGIGDLIADAMRWSAQTEVAVTNAGSIRGDKIYPPGTTS